MSSFLNSLKKGVYRLKMSIIIFYANIFSD